MSRNQCFKILYYFSKSMGLAPFAIHQNGANFRIQVSQSHKGNAYNCLLISFAIYLSCSARRVILNSSFPNKSNFVVMLVTSESIIGGIVVISLWIFVCAQQKVVVKIYRKVLNVDKISKNTNVYSSVKGSAALYFGVNAIIWISIMISDHLITGYFFTLLWITTTITCFVGSWFIIQYGFIANLLRKRFRELNSSFESLVENISPLNEVRMINGFLQLKNVYNLLYEITQEVSEFYSFPIFIITTFFCGSVVYTSYYFLQPFVYYTEDHAYFLSLNSIQYLFMELFPIVILTSNITSLTNEMQSIDTMVYKLMNRCVDCNELMTQIKRFSMTLLTRNNQFTAYNFFPIDCTLLHTIISTTATYLIILFQFQDNSKEDGKSNLKNLTTQVTQ